MRRNLDRDNARNVFASTLRWPEVYLLGLCQVVAMSGVAPVWLIVSLGCVIAGAWLSSGFSKMVRMSITICLLAWFILYYRLSFTVEIAANFLWLSATLKLLEIRSPRDLSVFVYIMLYVASVSFLFDQSIFHVLVQCAAIFFGLAVLLRLNAGPGYRASPHIGSIFKLFVIALPVVIVLFLFFPRISPLWTMPIKTSSASSGISDSMSPGDIAELVNSDERAFRASFTGEAPRQASLYWRGLVLDEFDGRRWSSSRNVDLYSVKGRHDIGEVLSASGSYYDVMLEPHNRDWLFALEGSDNRSTHVKNADMGLFVSPVDVMQPIRYRMGFSSAGVLDVRFGGLQGVRRLEGVQRRSVYSRQDLTLPRGTNPRTRQYVLDARKARPSDSDLVSYLLQGFTHREFGYTLSPPLLGEHYVDEFMFETLRGFCSHYAGSLAFMLRVAGIPARVVVGYQGGQYVPAGDYYIVRQYDAHAWVEAEVSGLGWVRLDPTARVAPERVEQNLQQALSGGDEFLKDNALAGLRSNSALLSWLALKSDQVSYQWQKWVVNYSRGDQYRLMQRWLGEYSLARVAALFIMVFVVLSLLVYMRTVLRVDQEGLSRVQKSYLRWLSMLGLFGYSRRVGETPRAFLRRIKGRSSRRLYDKTAAHTSALEKAEYKQEQSE